MEKKIKADKLKNVDDKARSVGAWILWEKDEEGSETSGIGSFSIGHIRENMYCVPVVTVKMFRQAVMMEMKESRGMPVAERYFCRKNVRSSAMGRMKKEQAEWFYRFWY